MAVDIYFKQKEYPFFEAEAIEVMENLDIFLQQLEMILTTSKGRILGDPNFGANLEIYLWDTKVSSSAIKQEILSQISTYIDSGLVNSISYDIEVSFIKGDIWDSVVVDIIIDGTKVAGYAVTP